MLAEEEAPLENTDTSEWVLMELATVHASLGETEKAAELLRRSLRAGSVRSVLETLSPTRGAQFGIRGIRRTARRIRSGRAAASGIVLNDDSCPGPVDAGR